MPAATMIPTMTGFDGFPPSVFYLDAKNGTLTETLPASATMASSSDVKISVWPRYLNAPAQALGASDGTQFGGRGKPNAYLKVQVTQDAPGASNTSPQTWAAMYPVIDNPNDDISSKFFDDPVNGDPVEHVPLPGATGELRIPLAAVVGGQANHSLLDILESVFGIATSTAGKALFPIPAADVALAGTVEDLINQASSAFSPATKMQYWISSSPLPLVASTKAAAADDSLLLPVGTNFLMVLPTGDNDQILAAVRAQIQPGRKFSLDRGGQIVVSDGEGIVNPNPLANVIYATLRVTVASS